ncbi:MAG: glycoside hydrolase [Candidatus Pedobacter colombiensis]|uniref:Glycoside hydrolase n=1 Tax=Candidatus Pedobacter colombiensis TaxID=3121371 RepID=A0AAJ5WBT0_9SPHI|nr:glycoside hydrolase [Pedobacter sp.]WEK21380.1 MAG: glycoside hydrolase [Pedobacter sp.]
MSIKKHFFYFIAISLMAPLWIRAAEPHFVPPMVLNGKWQMGFSRNYTATVDVPGIAADPAQMNTEKLWYKRRVVLPQGDWKYATLELKGARFMPEVYVNGVKVSAENGGMAPTFHLLKSGDVKPGNTLTLEVALQSLKNVPVTDASFIPPADQWRSNVSSCLWDDVVLHFHNSKRIDRIIPFINYERKKAAIHFDLTDFKDKKKSNLAKVSVLDEDNKVLISKVVSISGQKDSILFNFSGILKSWSPDEPNLYRLKLTVLEDGKISDQQIIPFGVKSFSIKDKQFYLNNSPAKLRGGTVVWHRWVRSAEGTELGFDTLWFKKNIVQRLKDHGANYLRFHLGKPPERLLDLCDKYGLMVQYEWSFFHGMPASKESLLEQYKNWLDVAMRHPSVVLIHPYNETEGTQLETVWDALGTLLKDYPALVMEERDVIHVHKYWWSLFENLGLYYDHANQFEKAIIVDEFGGNYLDEKGALGGYKALKESCLRFLGRENTVSERLSFHAASHAKVAEYWRRIGAAGFAPFCMLSSWEDGNTWFMEKLKDGKPKPVWNELTAAFSPQSVSLELWDKNFSPSQMVNVPVYFFNDQKDAAELSAQISIEDQQGIVYHKIIKEKVLPYSKKVVNVTLNMPVNPGNYQVKASLLQLPKGVKYPVVSRWPIQVYQVSVPAGLKNVKVWLPQGESELQAFLKKLNIQTLESKATESADLIIASLESWKKIANGDQQLKNTFQKAIESGTSIVLLDVGDRQLGQGYPSKTGELGPLQGVVRITDPKVNSYSLFKGISLKFTEAAEPESHIHPDRDNNMLWEKIPKEYTRIWNGLRGGLIVPAADMEFHGLSASAFITQWLSRGADEKQIITGPYYAYELQGFYEFSSKANDLELQKKLKARVQFLVDDAPALAGAINLQTPIAITDLNKNYLDSKNGTAERFIPLSNAGKNLTRVPIALIGFGEGKGKLIVSQLLTAGRLVAGFGEKGLYGLRKDDVAAQMVLNMMNQVLNKEPREIKN